MNILGLICQLIGIKTLRLTYISLGFINVMFLSDLYVINMSVNELNRLWIAQARLGLGKNCLYLLYLTNKLSSSPSLGLISKRVKLKDDNIFVDYDSQFKYIYIILYFYNYTYIQINLYKLDIRLCKFINKFLRYSL